MKNSEDIDLMFIGALRTNTGPIHIELMGNVLDGYTIPVPDKQLMFELSVALKAFKIRQDRKQINQKH